MSIKITVNLTPPLSDLIANSSVILEFNDQTSVTCLDLLELLMTEYPQLKPMLTDGQGTVFPAWRMVVNNKVLHQKGNTLAGINLKDGDETTLLLALAGG